MLIAIFIGDGDAINRATRLHLAAQRHIGDFILINDCVIKCNSINAIINTIHRYSDSRCTTPTIAITYRVGNRVIAIKIFVGCII